MTEPDDWAGASVASIRDLSRDVREFRIAPLHPMPAATPGSHIAVRLFTPRGEVVRTYSLLDGGDGTPYRIAVKRVAVSRGGSAALWSLTPGETLAISRPRNNFPLNAGASSILLIAGGIGITPIASMARALAAAERKFHLIYAVRSRQDLILHDELVHVAGSRVTVVVSEESRRIDFSLEFAKLQPDTEAYVCGPPGMMEAARSAWTGLARPPASLRLETFGSGGHSRNQDFVVSIPRLGRRIDVGADESLLDALERSGVAMIYSCRKGECGLCALSVLATDLPIDHRDVFFSVEERQSGEKLCTCVSRPPGGTLSLDTADRTPAPK